MARLKDGECNDPQCKSNGGLSLCMHCYYEWVMVADMNDIMEDFYLKMDMLQTPEGRKKTKENLRSNLPHLKDASDIMIERIVDTTIETIPEILNKLLQERFKNECL